jgi:cobalt-zinc-cadmium resistance protein CzcA
LPINLSEIQLKPIEIDAIDTSAYQSNPELGLMQQRVEVARRERQLHKSKAAPDLLVGFFSQTLIDARHPETNEPAGSSDRFTGFQIGLSLPLWFVPHQARAQSAKFAMRAAESDLNVEKQRTQSELQQAIRQLSAAQSSLIYYSQTATPNAELILKQSQTAFKEGEIGYTEYLLNTRNASEIQEKYLAAINDLNQTIIYIEYLTGKK